MYLVGQTLKLNSMIFERNKLLIIIPEKQKELDFLNNNLSQIYQLTESMLTKNLGNIPDDFNPLNINIYSLVSNNELEKYNVKKVTFFDVISNRNWDMPKYFCKSISDDIYDCLSYFPSKLKDSKKNEGHFEVDFDKFI